ncbi:MAG: ThiF family adenylyltransferase [Acidobacteria bacterium]|nr:ThiF family adenylyltransferase [Acidobacteriota bacterium]
MGRTVVVVGLGNIGSQVAPHLARMRTIGRVVLIDHGKYDETNVETQAITPGEVGRGKAQVQGLRLKRINPALEVTSISAPVEAVPLGRLRADAILACVDSRAARQYLNQAARHLGVTLVDSGVQADSSLARVSIFRSAPECACLECGWDQTDYDAIEQTYPCQPEGQTPAPTNAPAQLGAFAAAVQAIELQRLFAGDANGDLGSHEIVIDAASHRQFVTKFVRRSGCRLAEHGAWEIRTLNRWPEDLTLAQALALGGVGAAHHTLLRVESTPFVTKLTCLGCGAAKPLLRLRRSLTDRERTCTLCRNRMEALGQDIADRLCGDALPADAAARTLRSLGLDPGDIFSVSRAGHTRFYELSGATSTRGAR